MQQSHADLVQLVDRLPTRSQNRQTDVSVFVDIWMQDLVEALDLGWLEGVLFGGLEGEGDLGAPVKGPVFIGNDLDVEVGD